MLNCRDDGKKQKKKKKNTWDWVEMSKKKYAYSKSTSNRFDQNVIIGTKLSPISTLIPSSATISFFPSPAQQAKRGGPKTLTHLSLRNLPSRHISVMLDLDCLFRVRPRLHVFPNRVHIGSIKITSTVPTPAPH